MADRRPTTPQPSRPALLIRGLGFSALDVEILAWHYADGLSLSEIGGLLRITRSSVWERLNVLRRKLTAAGLPVPVRAKCRPARTISLSHDLLEQAAAGTIESTLIVANRREEARTS